MCVGNNQMCVCVVCRMCLSVGLFSCLGGKGLVPSEMVRKARTVRVPHPPSTHTDTVLRVRTGQFLATFVKFTEIISLGPAPRHAGNSGCYSGRFWLRALGIIAALPNPACTRASAPSPLTLNFCAF